MEKIVYTKSIRYYPRMTGTNVNFVYTSTQKSLLKWATGIFSEYMDYVDGSIIVENNIIESSDDGVLKLTDGNKIDLLENKVILSSMSFKFWFLSNFASQIETINRAGVFLTLGEDECQNTSI